MKGEALLSLWILSSLGLYGPVAFDHRLRAAFSACSKIPAIPNRDSALNRPRGCRGDRRHGAGCNGRSRARKFACFRWSPAPAPLLTAHHGAAIKPTGQTWVMTVGRDLFFGASWPESRQRVLTASVSSTPCPDHAQVGPPRPPGHLLFWGSSSIDHWPGSTLAKKKRRCWYTTYSTRWLLKYYCAGSDSPFWINGI